MDLDRYYQISPRVTVTRGDAVKVAGRRGLFRFVGFNPEKGTVEVVGPIGKAELTRTIRAESLRSAGRIPRTAVEMDELQLRLSANAKNWRTRRV